MRTLCCVAAILAATSLPVLPADLTPSALRSLLQQQGATALVQSLDEPTWEAFLGHVEAGDRGWIDMVPLLAPGTDIGTADSLVITLSRALATNPAAVFAIMAAGNYSVGQICSDNDVNVSASDKVRFIDRALVKVAAVLDPTVSETRNACLLALSQARIATLI